MTIETKLTLEPETISMLQSLIQINIDSRDGFRHAAKSIDNLTLSSTFDLIADDREAQANELSQFVAYNHEEPNRDGSLVAAAHRAWMDIREMLTTNNVAAILEESERGEDAIKQAYEDALKRSAGSAMTDVLNRHYARVRYAHDRIRNIRDASK